MVCRLTIAFSGGLMPGLNARHIGIHKILPGQRWQIMEQPISHSSLFSQDTLQCMHRAVVAYSFAAVNKAV